MPQLDLAWFFFNFLIAWILVLLVLLSVSNQVWKGQINEGHTTPNTNTETTQWRW
uniref:ATP synthase F0 subunit 8 n=1 Tax=Holothuria fuscogilva TaxID=291927 RepID=A0A8F6H9P4_HOLFS|nr:ATP synthase F0 subunit 8 [Holothuria fuscogilva]